MKITIDTSPIKNKDHKVRGVGAYINALQKNLKNTKDINIDFARSLSNVAESTDLLHIPYFDPFHRTVPETGESKLVITIHDLIPLRFPQHFPSGIKGRVMWEVQKRKLKNVDAIITDSQSSKNDIVKFAKIQEDKIHVVYLAADENFKKLQSPKSKIQDLISKHKIPNDFVLYVGDVTWNKNLPSLIKGAENKNIPLVIVGKAIKNKEYDRTNIWNKDLIEVQKLIKDSKNIYALGFVSEEELITLYNAATVFAFPTRFEGFGLPVLEAMQCGTPVVTSKKGSIPEVTQDAAYFVNENSTDDIADGIKTVFNDKKLQEELSRKGLEQAKKFSWEKTARETISVYEKILSGK